MNITELHSLTDSQVSDLLVLMKELAPDLTVTAEMLQNTVESPNAHLFAAIDDEGRIIGCATLCVFESPTGRKASVEDVVVLSSSRGQHLGKALMEHLIGYACRELKDVDLHLTSHPTRVAANKLYQSLGFELRGTNFYRMKIREAHKV